jgi:hypothetical protein
MPETNSVETTMHGPDASAAAQRAGRTASDVLQCSGTCMAPIHCEKRCRFLLGHPYECVCVEHDAVLLGRRSRSLPNIRWFEVLRDNAVVPPIFRLFDVPPSSGASQPAVSTDATCCVCAGMIINDEWDIEWDCVRCEACGGPRHYFGCVAGIFGEPPQICQRSMT